MHAARFDSIVLIASRFGFKRGVLAFMLATSIPSFRAADSSANSAPPAYPDARHLPQGCFISTLAFLARFRAAFPEERGQALNVDWKKLCGLHTVAVVTWKGRWWGRDEYFGVFPLDRRVRTYPDPTELLHRVEVALDAHSEREVEAGRATWDRPVLHTKSASERAQLVAQAAGLLPNPSEMFWVRCPGEELPVLFFRPLPGLICVYDPIHGTAQAESETTHPERLVRAFAVQLGYQVLDVRVELKRPGGAEPLPEVAGLKAGTNQ